MKNDGNQALQHLLFALKILCFQNLNHFVSDLLQGIMQNIIRAIQCNLSQTLNSTALNQFISRFIKQNECKFQKLLE
jgi:hypothetical protein